MLFKMLLFNIVNFRWKRPELPEIDPKKDKLIFQQLDIDHYIGNKYFSSYICNEKKYFYFEYENLPFY